MNKTKSILDRIGKTPLIKIERCLPKSISPKVSIYAKAEWFNPGGSVKDRAALKMVCEALASGELHAGMTLIDSTSGNTGIAYALIGASLGFQVQIVMPKNVTFERKTILQAYGAKITYTDPLKGSDGAREIARAIYEADPKKYFFPDQYSNANNWRAHYESTGPEIWDQTSGEITHFIAALGTSGTMMGAGRYLKEKKTNIKNIALQPEPFHGIEGWKNLASAIPVGIYDPSAVDDTLVIPTDAAYAWARKLAAQEGLLVGPSAGGALYGALEVAKKLSEGVIVTLFADGGDKYLSTQIWEPEPLHVPKIILDEIHRQAVREYPNECCGMLFGPSLEPRKISRIRPCRNVQNEYHKKDPDNFPREAKTAFFIDPSELLAIQKEIRISGEEIRVIYHSHIDAGAYFSAEDLRIAAPEGEPAYPGVDYLVISVSSGQVKDTGLFTWNPQIGAYQK